ncbi:Gfo/Idh/MocA family protein [Paenibacillus thermotolerans]|uniref:Gfo/Idh/MocA family protein n=1 Tax=Paenibacillus thermotolerans TaxID=3027807 RepID=UPI002368EFEC|nr:MULTISPECIES: Gfo/Idh/MocA family oxidoreductase [unclassified Paenibacillus]
MVRFGIIGTNWITDSFIEAAREVPEFSLTAVYSRTAERGREFAAKHGIPHVFTDLETMAASGELDAVYIASPNALHAEQAILLMNHGKHVLCEKPIASNARETQRMIDAANANGVALMEALKSTLLPNFEAIRDALPNIGKVRRFFASFCQYSSRYDTYKAGTVLNAFNPALSNGALMDLGIYCIYPMVVLFGKPDTVRANAVMLESGVDGEGSVLAGYREMEGVIMYSKITQSSLPCEIQGEDGSIVFDKMSQPKQVEIRYRDGRVETVTRPQAERNMQYEVREFIRLIEEGRLESSVNSHANSLAVMELMDEARKQCGIVYPADLA